VPVDPARLRGKRAVLEVAAAGPLSNLALALLSAGVYKLATVFAPWGDSFQAALMDAALFGVTINLFLAFFNLIPIQPLDGSKVFRGLLPGGWRGRYDRLAPYGAFVLVALIASHWLSPLVLAPSRAALSFLARIGLLG
jgi:Zn-dependent protease